MRASRLLAILILLQLRQRLTARALAAEFEVTERTIYRDIDALSAAGVPVYGDRGPGGGFQLLDGYRTRLTGLAGDEAEAMLMIGLPGPARALGLGAPAARARDKMLASLAPPTLAGAGRMGERFHLDTLDWYRDEAPVAHLPRLARAVLDEQMVAMRYESWTASRDWRIAPLGLVLKGGAWYCVAIGHGKTRTFKVANMANCAVIDERFQRPTDFDLAAFWEQSLARFEAQLRPGTATLRASPEGLRRLGELGAYASRAVAAAGPAGPDGWTLLRLPIEETSMAARTLIGLADGIDIVDPPELKCAVHDLAAVVARRFA